MENKIHVNALKSLIAKNRMDEVFKILAEISEGIGKDYHNEIVILYSQYNDLSTKKRLNLPFEEEKLNKLSSSLLQVVDNLEIRIIDNQDVVVANRKIELVNKKIKSSEIKTKLKISISITIGVAITIILSVQLGTYGALLVILALILLSFLLVKSDDQV